MKKHFKLQINSPCLVDLEKTKPSETSNFCALCSKNVIDLSNKSNLEISEFFSEKTNQSNLCVELNRSQLNASFELFEPKKSKNNLKYVALLATSVLISNNLTAQKNSNETEKNQNKTEKNLNVEKISFTLSGKVLLKSSLKPLSEKIFPKPKLYIREADTETKIDSKTGVFSVLITLAKNTQNIKITLRSGYKIYSQDLKLNLDLIKNNNLNQDILIDISKFKPEIIKGDVFLSED